MAITIKQIAEIAGVSPGTVDRALHNRPGINPEVARNIKKIAAELNYQPNALARGLANTGKTTTIGILINSAGNEFFSDVIRGIQTAEQELKNFGLSVQISVLKGYNVQEQIAEIDRLASTGIDALAVTPIDDPLIARRLNHLADEKITLCTLNSDAAGVNRLCFVGCEYQNSGKLAGELMGLMCGDTAEIAILTGSLKMLGHNLRIAGFRSIVEQNQNRHVCSVLENNDDENLSCLLTKKLLTENPKINALYFCAGGIEGGIRAIEEILRNDPSRKLKIITVDETAAVKSGMRKKIISATIAQQPFEQGYQAVKILFDYLYSGKKPAHKHIYTKNEVKLLYNLDPS